MACYVFTLVHEILNISLHVQIDKRTTDVLETKKLIQVIDHKTNNQYYVKQQNIQLKHVLTLRSLKNIEFLAQST